MKTKPDPSSWPELVYRFIEFYKWEPQHLARGKSAKEFQDEIRRKEVPLNFMLLLLLRWSSPRVIHTLLRDFGFYGSYDAAFHLATPRCPSYIQPDVCLESDTVRVFIELKVDHKLNLEQVQKYLLLHSELDIETSEKQPYLFFVTAEEFAKTWKPAREATNDVQQFLVQKTAGAILSKLERRVRDPKVLIRFGDVKQIVRYGATTWNCLGECLAGICNDFDKGDIGRSDIRMISDFVQELQQRGLYVATKPNGLRVTCGEEV